ncbi:CGNR zinc finger domain-containing protein [Ruegeria jejuensis]|uniref:CGNR zinc finger domain-containing protein n=1 Tax=Ruegeria jejuensis TaxID=3233338 RepID=UPI00355B4EC9
MKIQEDFQLTSGRLCLDLVSTLRARSEERIELLDQPDALAHWVSLTQFADLEGDLSVCDRSLAQAIILREAVHGLVVAFREGAAYRQRDIDIVNAAANPPALIPQLIYDQRLTHAFAASGQSDLLTSVMSEIARDAIDLITTAPETRVKNCENHKCERLFYDDSQAQRRRWCSMDRCGNRSKVKRYRSKNTKEQLGPDH